MADTETIRQQVQSRAPFSTWLGVVLLFLLFGAIVLAVIGPSPRGDNYEKLRAEKRVEKLKALNDANTKQLSTYGWIDKNKGSVHLPIDRAIELTVADLSAKKPAVAYPIATPEPQAPGGTAAASPAPAPSAQPRTSPKAAAQPGASATPAASPHASVSPASPSATPSPTPTDSPERIRPGTPFPAPPKAP